MLTALKTALQVASTSKLLLVLNTIRVNPDHVTATDKYHLIRVRVETGTSEPFLMSTVDVKQVVANKTPIRCMEYDSATGTYEVYRVDGTSAKYVAAVGDYPNMERVWPDMPENLQETPGLTGMDSKLLARFDKIRAALGMKQWVPEFYGTSSNSFLVGGLPENVDLLVVGARRKNAL